jgi:hypothetical protein
MLHAEVKIFFDIVMIRVAADHLADKTVQHGLNIVAANVVAIELEEKSDYPIIVVLPVRVYVVMKVSRHCGYSRSSVDVENRHAGLPP